MSVYFVTASHHNNIVMKRICDIFPKGLSMVEIDIYHIFTQILGKEEENGNREYSMQREWQAQRH